jgi:hypothetical protein
MSEESYETTEEYQEESAKLFELLQRRDKMRELLKIAQPDKIAEVRRVIANLDSIIKQTEEIMEMIAKTHQKELELDKEYEELDRMNKIIEPLLLAHLKEHNPEAYEKLKAELEEIDARAEEEDE